MAWARTQQPDRGQDAIWLVMHKGQFSANCIAREVATRIQHTVQASLVEALNKETDEYEDMVQITLTQTAIGPMQANMGEEDSALLARAP